MARRDDDEDDDRPRKKGKKKPAGLSPAAYWGMRAAVLGVLLAVLGGAGYLLKQRMAENDRIRKQNAEIEERNRKLAEEDGKGR